MAKKSFNALDIALYQVGILCCENGKNEEGYKSGQREKETAHDQWAQADSFFPGMPSAKEKQGKIGGSKGMMAEGKAV